MKPMLQIVRPSGKNEHYQRQEEQVHRDLEIRLRQVEVNMQRAKDRAALDYINRSAHPRLPV